jgi:hypothetical protein
MSDIRAKHTAWCKKQVVTQKCYGCELGSREHYICLKKYFTQATIPIKDVKKIIEDVINWIEKMEKRKHYMNSVARQTERENFIIDLKQKLEESNG